MCIYLYYYVPQEQYSYVISLIFDSLALDAIGMISDRGLGQTTELFPV